MPTLKPQGASEEVGKTSLSEQLGPVTVSWGRLKEAENMLYFGIVYKATNRITRQVYIGITQSSLNDRIARHIRTSRSKKGGYFHNAISLYGIEAFDWSVLKYCVSKKELVQNEQFYIAQYRSNLPDKGYNLTFGGDGCQATEETRHKISNALRGRRHSEETKKKIGVGMLAAKKRNGTLSLRKQTRTRISLAIKGKVIRQEVRQKISLAMRGNENGSRYRKPVLKLDRCGDIIERFSSIAEAARKCQLDRGSLSDVCKGKRKTCGGFLWGFENEFGL